MVPPEHPSQTPKIFYNVDRRNRITKKSIPVAVISAEDIIKINPGMIVDYLENFVKEVEICAMEEKEYQRRKNVQASNIQA
jgi:hypothetical protein